MVAAAEMREIPRKGACHGLQETPDGREILREEVLRRRLPDENAGFLLRPQQRLLHVWKVGLSDR